MTISLIAPSIPTRRERSRPKTVWFWQKWLRSASQVEQVSAQKVHRSVGRYKVLDLRSAPDDLVTKDLLGL